MNDRYLLKVIKQNWKFITVAIVAIVVISFIFKNVGESPYENQHLMNSTIPLEFKYNGVDVHGFVYISYWVKTKPSVEEELNSYELADYLNKHGFIDLEEYRENLIAALKTYSLEEIKDNWYDDYEYFKKRNVYFINNDKKLENLINNTDLSLDLPYDIKKIFFVYLDEKTFAEFAETM